jgi:putative flavoprotein involved in K+ transport
MTDTLSRTDARAAVTAWLSSFEDALAAGDVDGATGMFLEDSYWRDLTAFTWNIVTVEGPAGVRDLFAHTLDGVRPSGFRM